MTSYWLFVTLAAITILSPGPGVVLTLSNSIRYGISKSVSGVAGIAFGTLIVAAISATGVGVILATSALMFSIMKYLGAAYLIYLGIKSWRSAPVTLSTKTLYNGNHRQRFLEGLLIQITNPKAVVFFMSVFPQFADVTPDYQTTFTLLVATYCSLLLIIHMAYALMAGCAREKLATPKAGRMLNRISGGTFMCFGIGLASANR